MFRKNAENNMLSLQTLSQWTIYLLIIIILRVLAINNESYQHNL